MADIKVLVFGSLCNVHVLLENNSRDIAFSKKLREAFYRADYKQLTRGKLVAG